MRRPMQGNRQGMAEAGRETAEGHDCCTEEEEGAVGGCWSTAEGD